MTPRPRAKSFDACNAPRDPRSGIFTRPVMVPMMVGTMWSMFVNLGLLTWALAPGRGVVEATT